MLRMLVDSSEALVATMAVGPGIRGRVVLLLLLACAAGCVRDTPVTGRKQVLLMPESQEVSMGVTAYQEILNTETPSTNPQYIELVNRVGKRIANATGEQYDWEFKVIASDVQNAFCLPGGKVAIYEGILPVCQNEAGLAVVMSHEIAHAVARHGGERLSQGMMTNSAKKAVAWVTQDFEQANREITLAAFGVATEVGFILPYSRKHESEADQMGLVYMAKAGYDPSEAPRFWTRFATAASGSEKQPEFLSTHPSDERRAQDLAAQLPAALELYKQASAQFGLGQVIPLRGAPSMAGLPTAQPSGLQPASHLQPAGLAPTHAAANTAPVGWMPATTHSAQSPVIGGAGVPGIQGCLNGQCDHVHPAAHLTVPAGGSSWTPPYPAAAPSHR